MTHAYFFYGKAGSGKGTQAKKLQEYLESVGRSVIYIETGKLFRDFTNLSDTFSARRTADIIDQGGLMPPFFPIYMWSQQLIEQYDGTQDIIFDGVARRIEEAPMVFSALEFFGITQISFFHIHITDHEAIQRLSIRGDRADDTSLVNIQKRLDWYTTNVLPVIEYFKTQHIGNLFEINGEQDIEHVWGEIEQYVKHNH